MRATVITHRISLQGVVCNHESYSTPASQKAKDLDVPDGSRPIFLFFQSHAQSQGTAAQCAIHGKYSKSFVAEC